MCSRTGLPPAAGKSPWRSLASRRSAARRSLTHSSCWQVVPARPPSKPFYRTCPHSTGSAGTATWCWSTSAGQEARMPCAVPGRDQTADRWMRKSMKLARASGSGPAWLSWTAIHGFTRRLRRSPTWMRCARRSVTTRSTCWASRTAPGWRWPTSINIRTGSAAWSWMASARSTGGLDLLRRKLPNEPWT